MEKISRKKHCKEKSSGRNIAYSNKTRDGSFASSVHTKTRENRESRPHNIYNLLNQRDRKLLQQFMTRKSGQNYR